MKLIDADALIEKLGIAKDCNDCKHDEEPYCRWKPDVVDICEAINDASTIEPERKKGKWECSDDMFETAICSVCKWDTVEPWQHIKIWFKFCPNCGADMRGGHE